MSAPALGAGHLTVRVPEAVRDEDGVRFDAMLSEEGCQVIRELPRMGTPAGYVDLLVEDTTAPPELRGALVRCCFDEFDGALSFDRWELIEADEAREQRRARRRGPQDEQVADGRALGELSEAELLAELARRRAGTESG